MGRFAMDSQIRDGFTTDSRTLDGFSWILGWVLDGFSWIRGGFARFSDGFSWIHGGFLSISHGVTWFAAANPRIEPFTTAVANLCAHHPFPAP